MKNCKKCGTETLNPRFCSRSCASSFNNSKSPKRKLDDVKCKFCSLSIKRTSYKSRKLICDKCSYDRSAKNRTIADATSAQSLKRAHPSWRGTYIRELNRKWNIDLTKLPCANCGYDKYVELAHIKAVSSFSHDTKLSVVNDPSNIIQLCRNCHWEFDNGLLDLY
jgi:ribosomal protein L37E